ncbi:hypothetical protein CROQUDRAFT_45160 [Cronartium quercuum f. sp. fusiforme G11]|uniref:Alpha-galactosidase n=1 Tax=Cronartium quercuum f. sp. fusiforme G11 TaxID=708437 RepID=A0A9P6NFH1_9BASI|nr:hypothetical protein CROQUDRAFT_45160 [Cronartium quercuum f. sp. fusiforme G11]
MSKTDRLPLFSLSLLWLLFVVLDYVQPLDNGLSLTPAMGWNSWNRYGCSINEDIIIKAAEAIKAHGLHRLGYKYVNMDDCWQASARGPNNIPVADPEKFPHGIKYLADRIHRMGLKFGIYSDAGTMTCGKKFGSLGYETVDAKTYAEWGVDYLKYDNCYNQGQSGTPQISAARYGKMRDALNATGRQVLYSLCQWGEDSVWNWGYEVANSWRISGDICDNFDRFDARCPCQDSSTYCALPGMSCSVMNILEKASGLGQKASIGGWNDLDMLEVGNGGMSYHEYVTHFSMWAITKSPLILGNDLTNMSRETFSIISNKEIIAISQDIESRPGDRIWKKEYKDKSRGSIQLWRTRYDHGAYVMAFINATPRNLTYVVSFADFFFDVGLILFPFM